jgi:large subunit ribosomal protein L19
LNPEFIPPSGRRNALELQTEIGKEKSTPLSTVLCVVQCMLPQPIHMPMEKPVSFWGFAPRKAFRATFILRNTVDEQHVEIFFELYNPCIHNMLDEVACYILEGTLPKYRVFDMNMKAVTLQPSQEVPVNNLKVKMMNMPWFKCWKCPNFNIKGIRYDLSLTEE